MRSGLMYMPNIVESNTKDRLAFAARAVLSDLDHTLAPLAAEDTATPINAQIDGLIEQRAAHVERALPGRAAVLRDLIDPLMGMRRVLVERVRDAHPESMDQFGRLVHLRGSSDLDALGERTGRLIDRLQTLCHEHGHYGPAPVTGKHTQGFSSNAHTAIGSVARGALKEWGREDMPFEQAKKVFEGNAKRRAAELEEWDPLGQDVLNSAEIAYLTAISEDEEVQDAVARVVVLAHWGERFLTPESMTEAELKHRLIHYADEYLIDPNTLDETERFADEADDGRPSAFGPSFG